MALFMIARIYRNGALVGIRIIDINTNQIKDVSVEQAIQVISSGKAQIENLKVVNDELVGVNGAIDRYGIVGVSQSMTILGVVKNGNNTEGFKVSDCNGVVKTFRLDDILKLYDNGISVANGKMSIKDSMRYVSAINGEYEAIDIAEEKKKLSQDTTKTTDNTKQITNEDICDIFRAIKVEDDGNGKKYTIKEKNGRQGVLKAWNKYDAAISYMNALLIKSGAEKDAQYIDGSIICTEEIMVQHKLPDTLQVMSLNNLSMVKSKIAKYLRLLGMTESVIYFADESNAVTVYKINKDLSVEELGQRNIDAKLLEVNEVMAVINGNGLYRLCNPRTGAIDTALVYSNNKLVSVRLITNKKKYIDISAEAIIDYFYPGQNKDALTTYDTHEETCQLAERLISYSRYSHKVMDSTELHMVHSETAILALKRITDTNNRSMSAAQFNQRYENTEHYGALDSGVYKTYNGVEFTSEAQASEKDNKSDKEARMKELVDILNKARRAYEQEDREIMSNFEYDKLYDELAALEKELGHAYPNSPTQNVGYEVVSKLQKETHTTAMLSLDKTKEVSRLKEFLGDKVGVLSWKMDGLTVVLTYRNGELVKAVTRGNGEVGEIVTHNARQFKNIPKRIDIKGELIVRGEAIIKYSEFEKVNETMPMDAKFKNPRNLCSGSVRQLDSKIAASRNIEFHAFKLVKCEGYEPTTVVDTIRLLKKCGFDVVRSTSPVTRDSIETIIESLKGSIKYNDIPSDGLVLTYNDIKYGESLGRTGKFPRHSIAFKWQDELAETTITGIEWSCSRTGLINPVALFEPVDIEGSTVGRASIHNVSIMKDLELGIGDTVTVYKANMIIPQIADNLTRSDTCRIPDECPVCGAETEIRTDIESGVETLYCTNEDCPAKGLRLFTHFVSRDAMNIDGVSIATLERFMDEGFVNEFADIYKLHEHENEIINLDGFGVRSYEKMITSINKSREVKLANLIYALGIPNVGLQTAKLFVKTAKYDIKKLLSMDYIDLVNINGIGDVIADSFHQWFHTVENVEKFVALFRELKIIPETESTDTSLAGLTFCCTGAVYIFNNRNQLKDIIESKGGKLTGSVTNNTNYLITNDTTSGSTKNREAATLGIPIISEQQFIEQFNITI